MKLQNGSWDLEQLIAHANNPRLGHYEEQEEGSARIRKWLALADHMLNTDLQ
jgi:hypothetical protein